MQFTVQLKYKIFSFLLFPFVATMSALTQIDKRNLIDDGLQDLNLPVSIQIFLWGQIAPFIRPKLGKLHEAACQVSYFIGFGNLVRYQQKNS